jgi:hypothetical protein
MCRLPLLRPSWVLVYIRVTCISTNLHTDGDELGFVDRLKGTGWLCLRYGRHTGDMWCHCAGPLSVGCSQSGGCRMICGNTLVSPWSFFWKRLLGAIGGQKGAVEGSRAHTFQGLPWQHLPQTHTPPPPHPIFVSETHPRDGSKPLDLPYLAPQNCLPFLPTPVQK